MRWLEKQSWWTLAALAAAVHLLFVVAMWPAVSERPLISDAASYEEVARALLAGRGFVHADGSPVLNLMPGFPLFVALTHALFGDSLLAPFAVHALLIGASAALLGRATDVHAGRRAGLYAFLLLCALPAYFSFSLTLNAEVVVLTGVSLFIFATATLVSWRRGLVQGLALAWLAATKPEFAAMLAVVALDLFGSKEGSIAKRTLRTAKGLVLPTALVAAALLPWSARNTRVVGHPVALSSASGYSWWLTAHRPQLFEVGAPAYIEASARCKAQHHDEFAVDSCLRNDAKRMIAEHPAYYARTVALGVPRMLFGSQLDGIPGAEKSFGDAVRHRAWFTLFLKLGSLLAHAAVVLGGAFVAFRRRNEHIVRVFAAIVALKCFIHGLIYASPRYALHVLPVFVVLLCLWHMPKLEAGTKRATVS